MPHVMLRGKIERVAGLVEHQRARFVDQSPGNQHAARFARRHLRNWAIRQMWNSQFSQCRVCDSSVLSLHQVIGINGRAAEEPRKHNIETAGLSGARQHQIVGNNAQVRSQPEHIPGFLPKNRHRRVIPRYRITLPREGLDQGRFAAPVRTEYGNMLVRPNPQAEVIERDLLSAHHAQITKVE